MIKYLFHIFLFGLIGISIGMMFDVIPTSKFERTLYMIAMLKQEMNFVNGNVIDKEQLLRQITARKDAWGDHLSVKVDGNIFSIFSKHKEDLSLGNKRQLLFITLIIP